MTMPRDDYYNSFISNVGILEEFVIVGVGTKWVCV